MLDHCILFGHRGHLAQTRVIPQLEKRGVTYTGVSRSSISDLSTYYNKNVFAFMSIPTSNIIETIDPYLEDFEQIQPKVILEKPHGDSIHNFTKICNNLDFHHIDYIFNDHYIFKKDIIGMNNIIDENEFSKIHHINFKIHEDECINDRIQYFDSVGILLDMYQSHVLMIVAKIISLKYHISIDDVLYTVSKTPYEVISSGKYPSYLGTNDTYCVLNLKIYDVNITVDLKKNTDVAKKQIDIYDDCDKLLHTLSLSNDNGYDTVLNNIIDEDFDSFIQKNQIEQLWKHIEYNISHD